MNKTYKSISLLCTAMMFSACGSDVVYNREPGVFPGNPSEDFAPVLVSGGSEYRNLALNRAASHSSSFDYNLTAQLVTDGLVAQRVPATFLLYTEKGEVGRVDREKILDNSTWTNITEEGSRFFMQFDLFDSDLKADKFHLTGTVRGDLNAPKGYELTAYASVDGEQWQQIDAQKGSGYFGKTPESRPKPAGTGVALDIDGNPSPVIFKYDYKAPEVEKKPANAPGPVTTYNNAIDYTVNLPEAGKFTHFKVEINMPSATRWQLQMWDFYAQDELLSALPSDQFCSTWKSITAGEEWVCIDLGAPAKFDKVVLNWLNKAVAGKIQASDDAQNWRDVQALPEGNEAVDEIQFKETSGRYVRILCTKSINDKPYELSECQVFGKGGLVAKPQQELAMNDGKQFLSGGGWRLQRASEIQATGEELTSGQFDASAWIPATVPGTVLSSYQNVGAILDPNQKDNQLFVSESFFRSDFWYLNTFNVSDTDAHTFLNFDGINWKAEVFLNGHNLGRIDGAFMRGKFDVTSLLNKGQNVLAVKIIKNAHPGIIKEQTAFLTDKNGGILGADNPTFHASVGWDWIPTIRGRNIGIWNDVYLTTTGPVTIQDPFVRSELPLPDTSSADIFAEVTLKNHENTAVTGKLVGSFGEQTFEKEITLKAGEEQLVKLDSKNTPALHLNNPKLWWPVGYGEPYLYDVKFAFETGGQQSDKVAFKSGVRQMTYDESEYVPSGGIAKSNFGPFQTKRLSMYINGRRFIGFGGNWGFSESNLKYRARDYDAAVAYHADMNFTMIRNWVGQIGDEEFFEACDRHGVMIWQDFWLANPADGPDPYYNDLFMTNVKDFVKRIRNHSSIALYVGRNEGNPPVELDNAIREYLPQAHPGMHFISHSADGVVSGGGPYYALPQKEYFKLHGHDKFHSERGMPAVMNYESMVAAMGEENLEPYNAESHPNAMYGLHDYTLSPASAQTAEAFNNKMRTMFGEPANARQFAEWGQWINYNNYRATFEACSEHRRGMLLWMSHSAWPSMVWQTYDYYFDPTAAYFACKKACEPLHIQWNPIRDDIEVVNYRAGDQKQLTAKVQLLNEDGTQQWEKELLFDIAEDQTVACYALENLDKMSSTYFIKLSLTDAQGKEVSSNFYVRGQEDENYQSLRNLPSIQLDVKTTVADQNGRKVLTTVLKNTTSTPALMVHLQVKGQKTGRRILPALVQDNYLFLMPGEERTIVSSVDMADTQGETPMVEVTGFNLK